MYKRKNCELWTIERKDFPEISGYENIARIVKHKDENKFSLYGLAYHKNVDLLSQIDIILEINGVRYLGYWEFDNLENFESYNNYFLNKVNPFVLGNDFYLLRDITFVVAEANYLEGVQIEKEIEYVYTK